MRIGVISNVRSRQNRKDPRLAADLQALLGPDDRLAVTSSFEALAHAIQGFAADGIDVLAINGGDGTNHRTLTTLMQVWPSTQPYPALVLLRGGTMNTVSNGFGGSGTPRSILRHLVALRERGSEVPSVTRRLLRIEDANATWYGFIFGTGLVYNFLAEYYRHGDVTPVTAARTFTECVASTFVQGKLYRELTRALQADLVVDGEPWRSGAFIGILAATQAQIGLGFRPFFRADESPDRFPMIAIDGPLMQVVRALPAIRMGRTPSVEGYHERAGERLRIAAASAVEYVVDGELYTSPGAVELSLGPVLRILTV